MMPLHYMYDVAYSVRMLFYSDVNKTAYCKEFGEEKLADSMLMMTKAN